MFLCVDPMSWRWGGEAGVPGWSQKDRGKMEALCVYLTHGCTTLSACQVSERRDVNTSCQLDTVQLSHSLLFVYVKTFTRSTTQQNKSFFLCRKSWVNVISQIDFSDLSVLFWSSCETRCYIHPLCVYIYWPSAPGTQMMCQLSCFLLFDLDIEHNKLLSLPQMKRRHSVLSKWS